MGQKGKEGNKQTKNKINIPAKVMNPKQSADLVIDSLIEFFFNFI